MTHRTLPETLYFRSQDVDRNDEVYSKHEGNNDPDYQQDSYVQRENNPSKNWNSPNRGVD